MPKLFLFAPLLFPLLALWIWHPLLWSRRAAAQTPCGRAHRGAFWWCLALTSLAALLPIGLIVLMRTVDLSYDQVEPIQFASGTILGAIALTLVGAALRDSLGLLVLLALRRTWLWQPVLTVAIVICAVAGSVYGVHQGLQPPQVREHVLYLPDLPADLQGLRVAVLADLHIGPVNGGQRLQTTVQRTLDARPDLIVLPGDIVDGAAATQAHRLAPLAQLHAPLGVWAAPGNHEYYFDSYDDWANVFRELGMGYLTNEVQVLNVANARLAISGVGDPAHFQVVHRGMRQPGDAPDTLSVAQQARTAGANLHIMLGHQPKIARDAARHGGVHLQIAGHTHGGHVLGMDRLLVAPANDGFVRGLYAVSPRRQQEDTPLPTQDAQAAHQAAAAVPSLMRLFVSSGAAQWAGFSHRLGIPTAIDVLVLHKL